MTFEFNERSEDDQRRFLDYLSQLDGQNAPEPPKVRRLWRILGRLYLAWLRWRYGSRK